MGRADCLSSSDEGNRPQYRIQGPDGLDGIDKTRDTHRIGLDKSILRNAGFTERMKQNIP